MNISESGWLKNYTQILVKSYTEYQAVKGPHLSNEHKVYFYIQPTGLMYGYPVIPIDVEIDISDLVEKDKMKIILADCLIRTALIYNNLNGTSSVDKLSAAIIDKIAGYYHNFYPEIKPMHIPFFAEKKDFELLEYILNERVDVKLSFSYYWTSFFQNGLLFLDILYFIRYIENQTENQIDKLRSSLNDHYLLILATIAGAATSDGTIDQSEKNLFDTLLQSSHLPHELRIKAMDYIEKGVKITDLDVSIESNWLFRKYLLEIALLTIWTDKNISPLEDQFIHDLSAKLDFDHEDLQSSMVAIESFVLHNWEKVHYLKHKQNLLKVGNSLIERMMHIVNKNKNRIGKELTESKEVVELLAKSLKTDLSAEEKNKLHKQLLDMLKTIPMLAILALPGSFITLPILMQIIPKNILFPSAFQD